MRDTQIIERIKHGDEAAMNSIINKYARLLWTIADAVLERIGAVQDVEECVADVFIYLWQNANKYDAQKGKLKVWLSVITRSQAINRYRRLCKHQDLPFDDKMFLQQMDIAANQQDEVDKDLLIAAVHGLSEEEQDILIRRFYYEQKPKTIAIALDMPVKRVENLLYRAKQKLRQKLTNQKEALL